MIPNYHNPPRLFGYTLMFGVWLAVSAITPPALASNYNFLEGAPIASFTEQDIAMLQATLNTALDQAADGEQRQWQNPATGNSGAIKIIKTLTPDKPPCRRVLISNRTAKGKEGKSEFVYCKQADGQWKSDVPSQPATKPADKINKNK